MSKSKSKGKGKLSPTTLSGNRPAVPPLPNPATGSANPAASFPSLWSYMRPALDHIVCSPTNETLKAPAIDVNFYSGIHTACYNYFTAQNELASATADPRANDAVLASGAELYEHLDRYFSEVVRELFLSAPQDDTTLIHYVIPSFTRYSAGVHSVNRLLNYFNRHYVKRAVDEDMGWLRLRDVLDPNSTHTESIALSPANSKAQSIATLMKGMDAIPEKIALKMKERRTEELKKWGYLDGGSPEALAEAEACAETASSLDRVVPIISLAHRRFRTDFFEPLLITPKIGSGAKSKVKHKIPKAPTTKPPNGVAPFMGPKGRLARSVEQFLSSKDHTPEDKTQVATALSKALKVTGVKPSHPLRRRLEKYLTAT
ncbi:hypothetical protein PC9H_004107 [Pleurotus ostreatus]|uniref:Uncharacterized protein n=1 Tax=Pleurotus ostreatus TaxID=5322 RepID=A0A8H7DW11_PLEOS|nr:uncharacterized protein PC9H_004107 [Pleurotus ostreatus]KAF7437270.1 hypothetical protein PC9H_004107 [Pleurotus ostreatus]KAJ8703160.1 hypothetical protein PTI98_001807 [Pleurotus ostreatus]